jgi:hypothetical protein
VANPKLSTLQDAFTAGSINTALWNNTSLGQYALDSVNDLVALNVGTAAFSFPSFGSGGPWDATNSSLYAQITVAPNGNGGVQTILKLDAGGNNSVAMSVASGGQFKAQVTTNGSQVNTTLPTYDPHQHRWWKITEAGGSFVFAASPDGLNWTNLATMAYTFNVTAVAVYFQTGTSDTEPSGMVATIENVNTPLGGQYNPVWPLIEDAWAPYWSANGGTFPLDRYVEVTDRTRNSVTVSRGRQYELDQVRSGEASLTLANTDAALDPTNASGPWAGHMQPYQPYRRRAQWPASRNLLDQVAATGGDLGGYALGTIPQGASGVAIFSDTDSSGGTFVSSTSAWQGSRTMQFSVPSGAATNARVCRTPRWSVVPGQTYTMTMRVRNVTASTSVQVKGVLGWFTAGGGANPTTSSYGTTATLTGSATAAWTTITVTATAPAGAAGLDVGVALAANAAATCSVQVDGWQLEKGSASTAWACPGLWYPVYAGYMERWPSSWNMAGTYGLVTPNAVDAFSLLSQKQLSDPVTQEINNNSPRFVFKLDDPAGSTSVADWTGNNPAAQLAISKYGAGSLTFGSQITATDATGTYTGSTGTVATVNNSSPGTNLPSAATFINLKSAGIVGPANPTSWTRMIAFRYTGPTPTSGAYMWSCVDNQRSGGTPSGSAIYVYLDTAGKPVCRIQGPTGANSLVFFGGATNCVDGDWHLLLFGYSQATQQVMVSQDGALAAYFGGISNSVAPTGLISDNVGGFVDATVGNGTILNFKGDISFVAEFPALFDSTAITNMYQAWKSACAGESTDARYARILRYAGYSGPTSIQTGLTTSMGAANFDGQDTVSALQAVVDTEGGAHFVARDGSVQFKARSARYNALTPVYTFGERTDLGEWPYEDVSLDFDSTHLSNQVTVTQDGTGQNFYAQDATSTASYFPRSMSRTINSSSTNECQDAADYLLSRYKQPATRVSTLKLHPSAQPALWPVCLALELGTRVRVMRRPPGVPPVQVDCFVEQTQWDFGDDGEAWFTMQCSPADLTPYGTFASFHTTLNGSPAAGVTTITLNAGADTTNVAAAQIGQGQQLVLGLGTANQETVTVSSVGSTSPGWSTVAVTLQAATTKSHSSGDVVCEPLPAGVSDPTTWDASARFDVVNFAY